MMKMLLQAYPEWQGLLYRHASERMCDTFRTYDLKTAEERYIRVTTKYTDNPDQYIKSKKRIEAALAPRLQAFLNLPNDENFCIEVIHLLLIIYSCFAIPFQIGFDIKLSVFLIIIDGLCVIESVVFVFAKSRPSILKEGYRKMSLVEILRYYYNNNLINDILACSPFNLIFGAIGADDPLWLITPLRLLRLYTVFRIPSLIERIETYYRNWSSVLMAFKAILFLVYLWHWSSCLWFFVNLKVEDEDVFKWMNYNELEYEGLFE